MIKMIIINLIIIILTIDTIVKIIITTITTIIIVIITVKIFILTCSQSLSSHHPRRAHPLLRGSMTMIMITRWLRVILTMDCVLIKNLGRREDRCEIFPSLLQMKVGRRTGVGQTHQSCKIACQILKIQKQIWIQIHLQTPNSTYL